jgi:hypothetical protein
VTWADLFKLIHIGAAMGLVAGLVGRYLLLRRAAAAAEIEPAFSLSQAAAPFERMVIVGGNLILVTGLLAGWARGLPLIGLGTGWVLVAVVILLSTLPFVPLVFLPRGRVFDSAMAETRRLGEWTPQLRDAFADGAVAFARWYEFGAVAVVLTLMVVKPF